MMKNQERAKKSKRCSENEDLTADINIDHIKQEIIETDPVTNFQQG